MHRDRHIGSAGARPRKEDLLRTLLCLTISVTAREKPSSPKHWLAEVPRWYCVLLVPIRNAPLKSGGKNGGRAHEKSKIRPLYVYPYLTGSDGRPTAQRATAAIHHCRRPVRPGIFLALPSTLQTFRGLPNSRSGVGYLLFVWMVLPGPVLFASCWVRSGQNCGVLLRCLIPTIVVLLGFLPLLLTNSTRATPTAKRPGPFNRTTPPMFLDKRLDIFRPRDPAVARLCSIDRSPSSALYHPLQPRSSQQQRL